ncbi:MAG TPA: efflux RND transporter periplasmic adaptor subunit [Saprospiraceae bacterium]|nr:efflux RND transporter periplasmic adaptor subunit [Saprospiraceae bacterium]
MVLFIFGCAKKNDADPGQGMTEAAGHEDHGEEGPHEKMVMLNEAQVLNAGIDTGWFEMKNLSEVINANGYTKLPPQNQAEVSVQLPGTIQTIQVIEGQYVKKGQTLATLQSMAYNNMRLEREKLIQEMRLAESNLEYLKLEYARQKELSDENVTAKKIFQKVSADMKAEEGKVKALNSQIAILGQNIMIGGSATSPIINIVSPISGNVTDIDVTIGSSAEEGKPLFHIVDNSQMHVDLLVYEKDLFKVKTGQHVRFILTNQNNEEIGGKIFGVGKAFENETKAVAVHATIDNDKMLIPGMYINALIDIGASQVMALPIDAVIKAEGKEFIFIWEKENAEHDSEHSHEGHVHAEGESAHAEQEHVHKDGEQEHSESEHEDHGAKISFARIEVKTGPTQLGFVQVTPLVEIHNGDKIVLKGAYYLQSHLIKSEGGGGHSH